MPPKAPSERAIKSFFKLISLDLATKLKAELDAGMPVDVQFDHGNYGAKPALSNAIWLDKRSAMRVLLDAGANVNAKDEHGGTALHECTDLQLATELLDRGADIHAATKQGWTPLFSAAANGKVEQVALYLARGAAVDAVDGEGRTPYAVTKSPEIRALLKRHGAKGFPGGGGKPLTVKAKATVAWADISLDRGAIGFAGNGDLWMAAYSGVYRWDGAEIAQFTFEESIAFDTIGAGPDGVVYIATNWGLVVVKGETFTLYDSESSELFDNHLVYMRVSPDGKPHMISYEHEAKEKHISVFDGESFGLLSPGKDFPNKLEIECLGWDANGELVIGSDDGITLKHKGEWKTIDQFGEDHEPKIYDIATTADTLWLGSGGAVFEYKAGKFKKYKTEHLAKSIVVDGDAVWFGMYYGGVGRLAAGAITTFSSKTCGLPDDDVHSITLGPDGALWLYAGYDVCRIANGTVERKTGKPASPPPKKPALLAFPKKAIVAKSKLPPLVVDLVEAAKLASVTSAQLLAVVRPAIAFDCVKYKTVPVGASKFGGQPDLPKKLAWPAFAEDEDQMLPFVMQIDLAQVKPFDKEGLLPAKGMLYFFSDTSPDELTDARVLYADAATVERRPFPEDLIDRVKQRDYVAQVPEFKIELTGVHTLPSTAWFAARAELSDDDSAKLDRLRTALVKLGNKKLPQQCSRLLGWPDSVQEEIVDGTDRVALLQLNGYELSPKGIEKVFEHWCGDGLIHFVIDAAALAKKQFAKAEGSMAYT
ncbi:MAG: DUF1963 domain-containing protein [Kofleriaceae bacterium]